MSNPLSRIVSQVVARCAGLSALMLGATWIGHRIHSGFAFTPHAATGHPEAFNAAYTAGYTLATVIGGIGSISLVAFGALFLIVPKYGTALLVRIFPSAG